MCIKNVAVSLNSGNACVPVALLPFSIFIVDAS